MNSVLILVITNFNYMVVQHLNLIHGVNMPTRSYTKVFIITFLSVMFSMMYIIIKNHGLFLFAGDYYYQQIPFYFHASDNIRSGNIGWDWLTDLGSDFVTSYGFYLLGSIFFWTISWIPSEIIKYVMPVMLAVKTSIGAVGAFAYISRYVKNNRMAFIGAYLYSFSGFQMMNLIFNHFHDITALFPYLVLAFEMLVKENKRNFFAFMVALIALTNYYFFFGIVIFVVIYYIVKCIKKEFLFTFKNFILIIIESLMGVGLAAIILVPTIIHLSSFDRISNTLYGVDLISYGDNTIVPKIIQSMFIIPDPPLNAMLFKSQDNTHNWASISLYLPLFSITGVVTYIKRNNHSWMSVLIKICLVMAMIPGLNSAFSCFNASYYARWYFMPILIMCLATAKALEEEYDLKYGIKFTSVGLILLSIVACLPDKVIKDQSNLEMIFNYDNKETDKVLKFFSMSPIPIVFWQSVAFSAISLLFLWAFNKEKKITDIKKIIVALIGYVIIINTIFINNVVQDLLFDRKDELPYKILTEDPPNFRDAEKYRVSIINGGGFNNMTMIWDKMNISSFHSIISNEANEFYYNVQGKKRGVAAQYEVDDNAVYGLLSVKYLLNFSTGDDLNVEMKPANLDGFSLFDKQGMFYIYRNDYFVPLGVTYDYCIDDETLENYLNENVDENIKYQYKKLVMMRALVLDKEKIEQYKNYISPLPESMMDFLNEETYFSDCDVRSRNACTSFEYDSKRYSAEIIVDKPKLVYFSVPCADGWTAKVNGKDSEVIKAHYGLTAVAVEPGENKIEFSYETPGLKEGKTITFISLSVFVLYCFINIALKRQKIALKP